MVKASIRGRWFSTRRAAGTGGRRCPYLRRLWMEPLEDRRMLAVLMVDADASPGGDGLGWGTAYHHLQEALSQSATLNSDADAGNDIDAIWVAEGTYWPSEPLEPGDGRSATFSLVDGVTLYGGFAGTEAALDARDWSAHVTTLSGDLGIPGENSDNAYTVVYCGENIEAAMDGISITRGNADGSFAEGNQGGGIYSKGTLTVTNSTVSGNSASAGGGIYSTYGAALTLINSTVAGNSATYGGGVYSGETLEITNSTVSGNSATSFAGGINSAGTLTVTNSIVTLNTGGDVRTDVDSSFAGSNNLIGVDPGFVRLPSAGTDGDWGTADDDLGDLRLADRSPAINAGSNALAVDPAGTLLSTDLAGHSRIVDGTVDVGAYEHQGPPAAGREAPSLVVSATDDEFDLYDGDITLREAIYYSQSGIGDGTVTFDTALDGTTITLAGSDLWVFHSIVIDASALSSLAIDGDHRSRVFSIAGDVTLVGLTITGGTAEWGGGIYSFGTLTVTNSTFSGNSANAGGGGICSVGGLTVMNSTLSGNSASSGGGGIWSIGTLTVTNSTLSGNSAAQSGGGVHSYGARLTVMNSMLLGNSASGGGGISSEQGTLTITNSMLSGNSAGQGGGISIYRGTLTITNSMLSGNSAGRGGGIYSSGGNTLTVTNAALSGNSAEAGGGIYSCGRLTVTNSTLSGNSASWGGGIHICSGTLTATNSIVSLNAESDISGAFGFSSFDHSNSLIGIDPGFVRSPSAGTDGDWGTADDDLGDLRLTDRSPAINAGSNALAVDAAGNLLSSDLADNPRIVDATVDIGAYEYQGPPAPGRETPSLVVSARDDEFDLYDGDVTLREAIYYSQSGVGDGTVTFDAALDGTTISLAGWELTILHSIVIDASALSSLTIDADNRSRVFYITDDVTLSGLTVTGGSAGGIYSSGTLTVTNSTLSGNSASYGGGIYSSGTLTVTNSTLSGNSASYGGGGISSIGAQAVTTVTNSTLSGNSAFYSGGGIDSQYDGTLTVTNSTLSGNSAKLGAGGISNLRTQAVAKVTNSIVSLNSGGDIEGSSSGSNNLIGVDPGFVRSPSAGPDGNWGTDDDDLGDLHLTYGSPAVDAGGNDHLPTDTFDLDDDGDTSEPLPIDLAGTARVVGGTVDIGAYEFSLPEQFAIYWHMPQREFLPGQTAMTLLFNRELTTLTTDDLTLTGPDRPVLITSVSRAERGDGWSEYAVWFDPLAKLGEYQLTVMPTVREQEGGFLDQDLDGSAGESVDDRYVASWLLAGPRIESHDPSGTMSAIIPLAHFDMVFSRAMDGNSFSLDDIQALTGPNGAISPTGYEWLDDQTLRVALEPVTAAGTISITIGAEVYDRWGNALDQNQNAIVGEADDTWTGSVTRSISGVIDQDVVISSSTGEIVVDATVTIAVGAALTIQPGVTLKFGSGTGLIVNGQLIVQGTADQPVVFTSSAASPGSSAWTGIRVTSTGTIDLDHAEVRYAAKAVDADSNGAHAVLKNTTLRDGGFGVYVYSPYAEVIAENCLIANNSQTGIFVRADSRHSFKNCTIVGNGFGGSDWYGAGIHLGGAMLTLENSVVAFNNTGLHHHGDPPTATIHNSIFHNPAGQEISWNGDPGMPDLGADGNMTVDPLFVDRNNGNYQLAAGSPAIDSATGIHAPATDLLGHSRRDDQGIPNVGNGYPSFVDMGAFERQADSPLFDLAVTAVSNPEPDVVTVGDSLNLQWTVTNVGAVETTGTWQDFVYLSDDPYLGGDQLLATVDHTDALAAGASYVETLSVTVPATSGPKYVLVHTQLVGVVQREAVETNNLGVSPGVLAVDVPLLELGTPVNATATQGQWDYYRFQGEPGRTVLFAVDGQAGSAALYLRRSLPPALSSYDAVGNVPGQPDQELRLLEPVAGTYYVGVHTESLGGGSGMYRVSAAQTSLDLREVTPNQVGNTRSATIKIVGDAFSPDAEVRLIAPDGSAIDGEEYYQDSATLFATFDLAAAGATPGLYDVVVVDADGASVTAYGVVSITDGGAPGFSANLSMPGVTRPGRVIEVRIDYTNTSTVDVYSPVMTLDSGVDDTQWKLPWRDGWIAGPHFRVMGLSSDGPPTTLRPGQTESIVVEMRTPFQPGSVSVALSSVGAVPTDGSNKAIDWNKFEAEVRPDGIDSTIWAPALTQLKTQIGTTWGDYTQALRDNVQRWYSADRRVYCVRELFGMELDVALGFPTGIVSGRLLNAYTGMPVGNVEVAAWTEDTGSRATTITQEDGSFSLYGLGSGELGITVSHHLLVDGQTFELRNGEDLLGTQILITESGSLSGLVTDALNGSPIESATVLIGGQTSGYSETVFTTPDGYYAFNELPADVYSIYSDAEGYVDATVGGVSVMLGSSNALNFELNVGATIEGRIVSSYDGMPIEGADVIASSAGHTAVGAATDEQGAYALSGLEVGAWRVFSSADGYVTSEPVDFTIADEEYVTHDTALVPSAAIAGTIKDASGQPIAQATVVAYSDAGVGVVETNESGSYLIDGLAADTYTVEVGADAYVSQSVGDLLLSEGESLADVDFTLAPGKTIRGLVTDLDEITPMEDAQVSLKDGTGEVRFLTTSDDGTFSFNGLEAGVHILTVTADGRIPNQKAVEVPSVGEPLPLTVTLSLSGSISGRATLDDGTTAIAAASVMALVSNVPVQTTSTEPDGSYLIRGLPSGTYSVAVFHDSYGFDPAEVAVTTPGDTTADFVSGNAVLKGVVTDSSSGAPIEHATLVAVFERPQAAVGTMFTTSTDSLGRYRFDHLRVGSYWVAATADGFGRATTTQSIEPSPAMTIADFGLADQLDMAGIVKDATTGEPISRAHVWLKTAGATGVDPGIMAVSEADGTYRIDGVAAGTYSIFCQAEGYVWQSQASVAISAPGSSIDWSMLGQGAKVSGQLTESDAGLALGGQIIILSGPNFILTTVTSPDGHFALETVPVGTWGLRVTGQSNDQAVRVVVNALSDQIPQDLTLHVGSAQGERVENGPADSQMTAEALAPLSAGMPCTTFGCPPEIDHVPPYRTPDIPSPDPPNCSGDNSLQPWYDVLFDALADVLAQENQVQNEHAYLHDLKQASANKVSAWHSAMQNAEESLLGVIPIVGELNTISLIIEKLRNGDDNVAGDILSLIPILGNIYSVIVAANYAGQASDLHQQVAQIHDEFEQTKIEFENLQTLFQPHLTGYLKDLNRYTAKNCDGKKDPDPDDEERDEGSTDNRTSYTPEDKFGPGGYVASDRSERSELRFIRAAQRLDYRVEFWNKPDAPVPTQDAIIVDRIDPAVFDVSTLEITRVGFLNRDLDVSSGQVVDTRIDTRPEMDIAVEVKAGLGMEVPGFANNADIDENTLVFWFHTIDPQTGQWPEDPFAGFLPPYNPETGFEIGWIEYSVDPLKGLPSGTQLSNLAYVEFDFAGDIYDHPAPKVDPDVEPGEPAPWINTIDAAGPTSRVEPIRTTSEKDVLLIRWSGQDDDDGSGIASYDIYAAIDDGPLELWLDDTTDTEALYAGSAGHKYAFYSVATDNVGHRESAPLVPDAQTSVVPADGLEVTDVLVYGQAWHEVVSPYSLIHGSSPDLPLPWTNLDRIDVVFDRDVQVVSQSLTLAGVDTPLYSPSDFTYDADTFTATWTFAEAFGADKLLLNLAGEASDAHPIDDLPGEGGQLLGGGEDFQLRFDILPGDVTRDATTSVTDLANVATRVGATATPPADAAYDPSFDVNADGAITVTDLANVGVRVVSTLPDGQPVMPAALMATDGEIVSTPVDQPLQPSQLRTLVAAATARLIDAGLTTAEAGRLRNATFQIADLPGSWLGAAIGIDIRIDGNAAGHGWQVDLAPWDAGQLKSSASPNGSRAGGNSTASDRMDLSTVVMHELGHVLGQGHSQDDLDLMAASLSPGVRRGPETVDALFALPR